MSKKVCFRLFAISITALLLSFIIGISIVTDFTNIIFTYMKNPYLAGISVASILIIGKKKYHNWIVFSLAIVTAFCLQVFIYHGEPLSIEILYRIVAYYIYVYLVILIRYMI